MARHVFRYQYGKAVHQGTITRETEKCWFFGPNEVKSLKHDGDVVVEGDLKAIQDRADAVFMATKAAVAKAEDELRILQLDRKERTLHALKESA